MSTRVLYDLESASQAVSYGVKTLRRAIASTTPGVFPPPLKAKRGGRGEYRILHDELVRWAKSLPDA